MDFVANSDIQVKQMLLEIGINSIEELFVDIPKSLRLSSPTENDGLSEYEGLQAMRRLAAKNSFSCLDSYLGGGAYEHHIPAIVGAITSKSEFMTAYTPYQPEASQGLLQAIFEFQSVLCALTGMDVANASVYDGGSACAEALLMTLRANPSRHKVLIADTVHPHYRAVCRLYLNRPGIEVLETSDWEAHLDESVAGVLIQSPNFLGSFEDVAGLVSKAHQARALVALCANPISFGLFKSPGELGVDIAVGDCQPLGLSLHFGGPYAGYIACRQALVRQMPGRLVGETLDVEGKRGYVLTLQAREQHIRREKATSNICTNQALSALASLVTILWYGPKGMRQLALTNYQRTSYLRENLLKNPEVEVLGDSWFNEFVIKFPKEITQQFYEAGIAPGIPLGQFSPKWNDYLLVAVTETKSLEQLDRYLEIARKACR